MKIKRLAVNHFGKLKDLTLSFDDGINLISGENESGKSTLHSFFNAMFFGMERSRGRAAANDDFTRFTPWDGGNYAGVLEIEKGGKRYSVTRNFQKDARSLIITNETEAKDMPPTAANMSSLICDLSPAIYKNTISIGQLSAGTGHELADELRNHIINLKTAGNMTINAANAVNKLRLRSKRLENSFSKPAQQEAEELRLRIDSMEKDLAHSPVLPQINRIEAQKFDLEDEISFLEQQSAVLSDEISESENALRSHVFVSADEVNGIIDDINYYDERANAYLEDHRSPGIGSRILYILMTILSVFGILAGGWFGYSFFVRNDMKMALILWAAALLSVALTVILIIIQYKASDFRYSCSILSDIYENEFGEYPSSIGSEQVTALKEQMDHYYSLFEIIDDDREQLAQNRDALASAREKYARACAAYDNARQITWQYEQKEVTLSMLSERLAALTPELEQNKKIENELRSIDLAVSTIQQISDSVFESFGLFLEETSSDLIRNITRGAYNGISIDDNFNITLEHLGVQIPINRVSTGTLDQVYLAVRLACVEFLWPDETMPLLFDDTFAMYDKERLKETLRWLSENYAGQIFIFTCHSREEELLNELKIPYRPVRI